MAPRETRGAPLPCPDRVGATRPRTPGLLISDFNAENLRSFLNAGAEEPWVEVGASPIGQAIQTLADGELACWRDRPDFAVVWTRPESVLEEFRQALDGAGPVEVARLEAQVDDFCDLLLAAKRRVGVLFVPTWAVPGFRQGHGMQDFAAGSGVSRLLMQANLRLLQNLDRVSDVYALNTQKWMEFAGNKSFNPRLWYLAKIPFGTEVFKAAVSDIKAALRGVAGKARKLIVLDLDDTLWGGTVGEVGWQNLVLGGHDPAGEALVDFQKELKALSARGLALGIVSKNEEATALEAIEKHPEMVLRLGCIAGWRINWADKARNISELAAELNVGLDSVVFIDDNPAERDRVREALPEVLVPEWPADKRLYVPALLSLPCFAKPFVSEEDRQRSSMYVSERERTTFKVQVGSVEKWLESLGLTMTVESLDPTNLSRAVQLLNKTNQMNLATRRLTEEQFAAWAAGPGRRVWLMRVSDKFGDSGLTGIGSMECRGAVAGVVDFILSCRVMGRRIEEAMLGVMIGWARANGLQEVEAVHRPTARNKPCRDFLLRSGMKASGGDRFVWSCHADYPAQGHIRVLGHSGAS